MYDIGKYGNIAATVERAVPVPVFVDIQLKPPNTVWSSLTDILQAGRRQSAQNKHPSVRLNGWKIQHRFISCKY